jgi:L-ascorbate metabolism protein UlaG (beta-lactamase superfamily)
MNHFMTVSVPEGCIAIGWFGQSSFALKGSDNRVVLIDPYFPHERPPEKFIHPEPPLDEKELRVDYVLLTHDHSDHTDPETLKRIRAAKPDVPFLGPTESIAHLQREAVDSTGLTTLHGGQTVVLDGITVFVVWAKPQEGIPAEGILPPDVQHFGFVVEIEGQRVYISGDAEQSFAEQESLWRPVADLKPDVGFLTTHPTEGEFPFFAGSAAMGRIIGLKHAIPAHYQCFVKRNYDAQAWAAHFRDGDPEPLIIPYKRTMIYPPRP